MRSLVAVLLLALAGCGQTVTVTEGGPCVRAVTTMLDHMDDPDSPAASSDTPFDLDACTSEDRQAAAALLDVEFSHQMATFAAEGAQPLGEDRAMLNLIAILATAMRPPSTFMLPEGWPVTFPVHLDAQLRSSEQSTDDTLNAHWVIPVPQDPATVIAFYEINLQQGVPGRWDFHTANLQQTGDDDQVQYDNTYLITGEGHRGTVHIKGPDDSGDVHIHADLHRQLVRPAQKCVRVSQVAKSRSLAPTSSGRLSHPSPSWSRSHKSPMPYTAYRPGHAAPVLSHRGWRSTVR